MNRMRVYLYKLPISLSLLCCACNTILSEEQQPPQHKPVPLSQWITTARDSSQLPLQNRKALLHQAYTQAQTLPNDSLQLQYLSDIAWAHYKSFSDTATFRTLNYQILQAAQAQNQYATLGKAHWRLSSFFEKQGKLDSTFYHYRKALKSYEQLPADSTTYSQRGKMLYSMGRVQSTYKDYLGADRSIAEAITHFRKAGDYKRLYRCYNMWGITAVERNDGERALRHYTEAQRYLEQADFPGKEERQWILQNNMAYVYLIRKAYPKAQALYTPLLRTSTLPEADPELYAMILASQGYTYFKGNGNLTRAQALLSQALQLNDSLAFWHDQPRTQQYYAELKAAQGDTLTAIEYAQAARALAQKTSNNDPLLESLQLLTQLHPAQALSYAQAYYTLNEHIQQEERTRRDKFARLRLETDDVIAQNKVLIRQKEAQILLMVALGLFVATAGGFTISYIRRRGKQYRQKQKQSSEQIYTLMLDQHGKVEEGKAIEKKRISEELHDGVLGKMLGIRLVLMALNRRSDDASMAERRKMLESLQQLEVDVRNISHDLHDDTYEEFQDFPAAVEALLGSIRQSFRVRCRLVCTRSAEWYEVAGFVKMNLYRILQETMKNGMTHGQCNTIDIDMELDNNTVVLTIADNGKGFDTKRRKDGIGLKNMNSRIEKINGKLYISSVKNKGTTIRVVAPKHYVEENISTEPDKE